MDILTFVFYVKLVHPVRNQNHIHIYYVYMGGKKFCVPCGCPLIVKTLPLSSRVFTPPPPTSSSLLCFFRCFSLIHPCFLSFPSFLPPSLLPIRSVLPFRGHTLPLLLIPPSPYPPGQHVKHFQILLILSFSISSEQTFR